MHSFAAIFALGQTGTHAISRLPAACAHELAALGKAVAGALAYSSACITNASPSFLTHIAEAFCNF